MLVGNHQLFGSDLGPLVREFLVDRGVLARGLAYPGAMRTREGRGPPQFQRFGAVPVSPRNIFKLLQRGAVPITPYRNVCICVLHVYYIPDLFGSSIVKRGAESQRKRH